MHFADPEHNKQYDAIYKLVLGFFKGDEKKAGSWMLLENHLMGGLSAVDVIVMGRGERLLKMIRNQLDENRTD